MRKESGAGIFALFLGATAIGWAPLLVRWSQVGPIATGFYRIALAQPVLWAILAHEVPPPRPPGGDRALFWAGLGGLCFAGDLAVWHWSIQLTTIANSTFLTNLSPFLVTLGGWLLFRERITLRLIAGMSIAFAGGFLMVFESLQLGRHYLAGDLLALGTAFFYSGYLLAVKQLRSTRTVWFAMAWTGVFTAPVLLLAGVIARERFLPGSARAWGPLIALALISHAGGQGLIAYGLKHVSASASSIILMWQPVVAALLAWWLMHEPLTALRLAGAAVILCGIALAAWRKK